VFRAAAARHRILDDFDIRIFILEGREHGVGGFTLAGGCPPVEDFQLFGFRRCRRFDDHCLDNFRDLYLRLAWDFDDLRDDHGLHSRGGLRTGGQDHACQHQDRQKGHGFF
jgi:hypothetical protein